MEAFIAGDVITPHYGLRLYDKHSQSFLFRDTDVAIVLTAQKRVPHDTCAVDTIFDVTLLHGDGQIRHYPVLDPQLFWCGKSGKRP